MAKIALWLAYKHALAQTMMHSRQPVRLLAQAMSMPMHARMHAHLRVITSVRQHYLARLVVGFPRPTIQHAAPSRTLQAS